FRTHLLRGSAMAILLFGGAAAGQAPAPGDTSAAEAKAKAEAERYFQEGEKHFDDGEYREAYEQYRKSLDTKKTRGVLAQAASSLKQLGRYDEALDLLEELRRDFPSLPPKLEAKVATLVAEVQGLVGTLVLAGDVPDGALVLVDDRVRGKVPLPGPLRVS